MDFFNDDPCSVVNPKELVMAFAPPGRSLSGEFDLERLALVTFTAHDLRRLVEGGQQDKPVEAWRNRGRRIYRGNGWIGVRSPYGAPGTVVLLEELAAFGVKRVLFLGYCGAIKREIRVGDIVLPLEAIREEGTSYHYLPGEERSRPDLSLQNQVSHWLEGLGFPTFQGTIWTTDAPYRETTEKVGRYCEEGVLGVEMEMAAAFAVGRVKGISVGAVLLVSDEVRQGGWHAGFLSPAIQSTREKVIEALRVRVPEMSNFV
jgi:uridine phosphorylase